MKRLLSFGFLGLALALSLAQGRAGIIVNVNFDEFGNGSTDYQTPLHTLGSEILSPDPTGGVSGSVLIYVLPFNPVQGDLHLSDSAVAVVLGDVVRFVTVGNTSFMVFYSDNGDGVDATADASGLPGNTLTNVATILEVGPEGANGAKYVPTPGQPGYFSSDFTSTYNITSDSSTPEPGSVFLMMGGLAGLGLLKLKLG
jgi:hypothetical protein